MERRALRLRPGSACGRPHDRARGGRRLSSAEGLTGRPPGSGALFSDRGQDMELPGYGGQRLARAQRSGNGRLQPRTVIKLTTEDTENTEKKGMFSSVSSVF